MARPRRFEVEELIRVAARLFASQGYLGTSISDLTEALGILRGSLYQVFPDKHSLMLVVLDRYRIQQLDEFQRLVSSAGLREALLHDAQSDAGRLVARLALELTPADRTVTERISRHYQQLSEHIEDALPPLATATAYTRADAARLLLLTVQGLRTTPLADAYALDLALSFLTVRSTKAATA